MDDPRYDFGKDGPPPETPSEEINDRLVAEVALLRSTLKWVRQTIHQAHHDGPIEKCRKNTCDAITQVLTVDGK